MMQNNCERFATEIPAAHAQGLVNRSCCWPQWHRKITSFKTIFRFHVLLPALWATSWSECCAVW